MSNRALSVVIVLVVVLFLGGLWYRLNLRQAPSALPDADPGAPTEERRRPKLRVVMTECKRAHGRTEMTGYVENTGTVDLRFVTVQSLWKDAEGRVIATDVIYVVSEERLAPGQRAEFHDVTSLSAAARCNARPLDWWS